MGHVFIVCIWVWVSRGCGLFTERVQLHGDDDEKEKGRERG